MRVKSNPLAIILTAALCGLSTASEVFLFLLPNYSHV